MKDRRIPLVVLAGALLSFSYGCVVAERPRAVTVIESERRGPPPWAPAHGYRRQHETYYYYPDVEVYYYPSVRRYYWAERGEWRYAAQPPRHYVIQDHRRVVLDLDYEPHTRHTTIKKDHPPGHYDKDRKKDKDDRRDRD